MQSTNLMVHSAKRIALILALAGMLLSIPMFGGGLASHEAKAGGNGQQIQVSLCFGSSITFSGYNQWGQWKVATFSTSGGTTKTTNWWWVGNVTATSRGTFGTTTTTIYVPKSQWWSDWVVKYGCA